MKNIGAVLLILGSLIGAGFATGKEIYVFYASYGMWGLVGIILSMILFYFICLKYLEIGKQLSYGDGKNNEICELILVFCVFMISATLFSASNEFDVLKIGEISLVGIATLIITMILTFGGIDRLSKFSIVIVPIMVVVFLIIVIGGITANSNSNNVQIYNTSIFGLIFKSISYVGINTLLTSKLIIDIGKDVTKPKVVSLLTTVIFGTSILIASISLIISNGNIINSDMPIYMIAKNMSRGIRDIYLLILWLSILTSVVSGIYIVSHYFMRIFKNKVVCIICISIACYLVSFIGFSGMVECCYPMIGVFGLLYFYIINKQHKKYKYTQNSIKIHKN